MDKVVRLGAFQREKLMVIMIRHAISVFIKDKKLMVIMIRYVLSVFIKDKKAVFNNNEHRTLPVVGEGVEQAS